MQIVKNTTILFDPELAKVQLVYLSKYFKSLFSDTERPFGDTERTFGDTERTFGDTERTFGDTERRFIL